MKCKNCGKQVIEGSKFCQFCGSAISSQEEKNAEEFNENAASEENLDVKEKIEPEAKSVVSEENSEAKEEEVKVDKNNDSSINETKRKKGIMFGGIALVLLIIILRTILAPTKINLNKLLTVNYNGYDGIGTVSYSIDRTEFRKKYAKKVKLKSSAKRELEKSMMGFASFMSDEDIAELALDYASGSFDKINNLSNGDTVKFTWNCDDEELEKYFKCKFVYKDIEETVEGLEQVQQVNPFDFIDVSFDGTSPNGVAIIEKKDTDIPLISNINFVVENNNKLKNGEKVTIKVANSGSSDSKLYAERYGMIPVPTTKEYDVEGLYSYIESASSISDDNMQLMQNEAEDKFNAIWAQNVGEYETLNSLEYIGDYVLMGKENHNVEHNYVYLVYKYNAGMDFSNSNGSFNENRNVYWYCGFPNVSINEDGDIHFDSSNLIIPNKSVEVNSGISTGWWSTASWKFTGYESLDSLYMNLVTANLDNYTCEENVMDTVAEESTEEVAEEAVEEAVEEAAEEEAVEEEAVEETLEESAEVA